MSFPNTGAISSISGPEKALAFSQNHPAGSPSLSHLPHNSQKISQISQEALLKEIHELIMAGKLGEARSSILNVALEYNRTVVGRELTQAWIKRGGLVEAANTATNISSNPIRAALFKEIAQAWIKLGKLEEATSASLLIPNEITQTVVLKEIAQAWLTEGQPEKAFETASAIRMSKERVPLLEKIEKQIPQKKQPVQAQTLLKDPEKEKEPSCAAGYSENSRQKMSSPRLPHQTKASIDYPSEQKHAPELTQRGQANSSSMAPPLTTSQKSSDIQGEFLSLEDIRELIHTEYLEAASDSAQYLPEEEQVLVYQEIAQAWIKKGNPNKAKATAQLIHSATIQRL